MDYILVENEKGKKEPQKVGLMPIQRDDTEYEFDIVFDIARSHIARVTKDTTYLDSFLGVITPELGADLRKWLDEGAELKLCSQCGKVILPIQNRTVQSIVDGTTDKTGMQMCIKCFRKWMKANESEAISG